MENKKLFYLFIGTNKEIMTTLDKPPSIISSLALYTGIAIASFACYARFSSLFFIADDFIWIERAKDLHNNPLSLFNVEGGRYFDPLVHLSFWLNYKLNGLGSIWYHRTDLLIHTGNSFLVAYLAMLLTKSKATAFLSGLIFAVTPTNADAVLWLSSRVDTLAAQFYLSSIISYILYINKGRKRFYLLSLIFYIASLSAKVTPLFLPIVNTGIAIHICRKKEYKKDILALTAIFTHLGDIFDPADLYISFEGNPIKVFSYLEYKGVSKSDYRPLFPGITYPNKRDPL